MNGLVKRSFSVAGHRTSVAMEAEFWTVLQQIARQRRVSLAAVVAETDAGRGPDRPLASALRVMALKSAAGEPTDAITTSDNEMAT